MRMLLNLNIAARECAAGRITIAQSNGEGVRASVAADIRDTDAVGNCGSIAQTRLASQGGGVATEGQSSNFCIHDRDASRRIAESERAA